MIGLLQRVKHAHVTVDNTKVATIDQGLLVLVGIEKNDSEIQVNTLLKRILGYRVFSDDNDKMNLSLQDINGELLLVPQFTLPADTNSGMRPSFTPAASPEKASFLFKHLCAQANQLHHSVKTGQFGADMQVSLTNDGPVTFWLQTK